ncbi:MAG: transporter ATP-binding protein [Nocardioides sp.]|jgi:molybdate transport system ATP-binding protein|uniref:sulfate/molybdate ABC transporter ATP-binding protein n=1 Tax=Nocardioides sp. TaxID=35761 RepID=UPI0026203748|nr:ABC transporter ATP-binding protein [Nocardioides sp.]MCW2835785.1 transporter ATP-binding protein [Nocardioides sp.]
MTSEPTTEPSGGLRVDLSVPGRTHVELTADVGSVVAVIGPNGAGKSSFIRALAGLITAHGTAVLDGTDLLQLPARDREVGMVFQGQLLFPHLSALDNVAFGPRSRGRTRREADRRAQDLLDAFGVGHLSHRRPGELSGGEAQRVAIARALATRPRLLLLDEPFAGLDVTVAMGLRVELANHLATYDGIAILITHEAIDALTLADQVLVLDQGRVAQRGSPQEVAARPATDHVARLVGVNLLRDRTDDGEELTTFSPRDVTVSLVRPAGSARLQWQGPVASAQQHGDAVRLLIDTDPPLLADVTPQATAELGLAPGREVWLSVKATAVSRYSTVTHDR